MNRKQGRGGRGQGRGRSFRGEGSRALSTDANTAGSTSGLKKSTRNWTRESDRSQHVHELPLVSRSGWESTEGLQNREKQNELFSYIQERQKLWIDKAGPLDEHHRIQNHTMILREEAGSIILLHRKLREGLVASRFAHGDYTFAQAAFEQASIWNALCEDQGELVKSLTGLVDDIYPSMDSPPSTASEYISLLMLHYVCHSSKLMSAYSLLDHPCLRDNKDHNNDLHIRYATQILQCRIHYDYTTYFRLVENAPTPAHAMISRDMARDMQRLACSIIGKSYRCASIPWLSQLLSIVTEQTVETVKRHLERGVERIDDDEFIWFKKALVPRA
ncbi:hypothetical protein BZG36_01393 [Bifiguratus adelaidae]|uniref:Uncharacterized protein n=1 Tax=Bifiguratus adelaidae TaxID=1938954 RepID=A0A261Y3G1_9FUNG|nr:hypothetical protein BZG36_01393 [Bifiguratus adelaidae]